MSPVFIRSGDDGTTGLLGKGRIQKDAPRMEALGAVDEASAALGLARSMAHSQPVHSLVLEVQRDLYYLMAELAATPDQAERFRSLDQSRLEWLENQINEFSSMVNIPNEFILPGDSPVGAAFSLARTIIRRAERRLAGLFHTGDLENPLLMQYLNRLSSLCFILELYENQQEGKTSTLAKEGQ